MPLYEYQCNACEKRVERLRKVEEKDSPVQCPDCDEECFRTVSMTGQPHFSGAGWTPQRLERKQ